LVELIYLGQKQERIFGQFLKTEEERLCSVSNKNMVAMFQAGNGVEIGLQLSKILRKVQRLGQE
jgi:hypothetical protein